MWINITLNEGFTLDSSTVKCLTLVSRYFANTLKNYIEHNYWFNLKAERTRRLTYYSPMNQKKVQDISEILSSTKRVVFHKDFNKEVDYLLLQQLTHITFGKSFNRSVDRLPNSITHLQFGEYFNQLPNFLPCNLTHLSFGVHFDKPITRFPCTLAHIHFGFCFSHDVSTLPLRLQQLSFGHHFNEHLWNLPSTITHIKFGACFNKVINGANLPAKLTHLEVGSCFDREIETLPPKVQQVIFAECYCGRIDRLSKTIIFLRKRADEKVVPFQQTRAAISGDSE
eukprot:TRINITY_DN4946_c0_g1_i1.p1 TRINITY_DN4946_c0_g1~~TRINITY_DN4946_c0_g1_i1.p1  ORF type:complete len:283 (+),score=34.86 TRINITY_DN4946_c0_g1_i1:90-938(+)